MRLAYAFEVLSVGLLIWLAPALVVHGIVYLAPGDGVSWDGRPAGRVDHVASRCSMAGYQIAASDSFSLHRSACP